MGHKPHNPQPMNNGLPKTDMRETKGGETRVRGAEARADPGRRNALSLARNPGLAQWRHGGNEGHIGGGTPQKKKAQRK